MLYAVHPVNPRPASKVRRYVHRKKRNLFFGCGSGAESAYDRRKVRCTSCLRELTVNGEEAARRPLPTREEYDSDLRDRVASCIVAGETAFGRIRSDPTAMIGPHA